MNKFYAVFYEKPEMTGYILSQWNGLYSISDNKNGAYERIANCLNLHKDHNPTLYLLEGEFLDDIGDLVSCAFNGDSFSGARFSVNRLDKISQTNELS